MSVSVLATDEGKTEYQIMSAQEVEQHKAKMASLSGDERNSYRDSEYAKLKERAAAEGYALPDAAPWNAQAAAVVESIAAEPAPAAAPMAMPVPMPAPVAAAAEVVSSQMEKAQAMLDKQTAHADANMAAITQDGENMAKAQSDMMEERRVEMRKRLDDFLAKRDEDKSANKRTAVENQRAMLQQRENMYKQRHSMQEQQAQAGNVWRTAPQLPIPQRPAAPVVPQPAQQAPYQGYAPQYAPAPNWGYNPYQR